MSFGLIAGREVEHYVNDPGWVIIDLREYDAFAAGHIEGAQNLPYRYFEDYMYRLPDSKRYILYCHYGSASMMAGKRLQEAGYDVLSISGGISSYRGRLFV